jgi:hypothetical protein
MSKQLPRYMAIARCVDHIQQVKNEPRFAEALQVSEERLEKLMDSAPWGSGFDRGTHLEIADQKGGQLRFDTAFHHLNDNGTYDGWTEHTVTVKPSLAWCFELKVGGRNRNDIKEYIVALFNDWLSELVDY